MWMGVTIPNSVHNGPETGNVYLFLHLQNIQYLAQMIFEQMTERVNY